MADERPGVVDEIALREVTAPLASEHDLFADYLTIREIAYVTRLSASRIRHALTYARKRPMDGIKRADRWFVSRSEALRWASVVAEHEMRRWTEERRRIGRLIRRENERIMFAPSPPRNYDSPPAERRVYTYDEAAKVLDTTRGTIQSYLRAGNPLAHVRRYVTSDARVKVLDAEAIDAYARDKRNFGRRAANQHGPKPIRNEKASA